MGDWVTWAMLPLLAACAVEEDPTPPPRSAGAGAAPAVAGEPVPVPAGACAPDTEFTAGDHERELAYDGDRREYRVHVPPGYARLPSPVVFNFHGYLSSPDRQEEWTAMTATADTEGFILVYPSGPSSWNGGECCGTPAASNRDDVGFVDAMIDAISEEWCVDPARVYATGFSNGGFLSHRLGCMLSDRIAAIASVAGVLGTYDCAPARPMPVLHVHGTADAIVPFGGNAALGYISVEETVARWLDLDECSDSSAVTFEQGDSLCESYSDCAGGAEVAVCVVDGGGHTWPGGNVTGAAGHTSRDLLANDAIWEFFAAHPLP